MTKKKEKVIESFSITTEEVVDEKEVTGTITVKPIKHTLDEEVK